jgi:hypothetical protein
MNILVAYQDVEAEHRAKVLIARLAKQPALPGFLERTAWWKFDWLDNPKLRTWVVTQAVGARMIIVSAQEGVALPLSVKRWIADWLLEKDDGPSALVGILNSSSAGGGVDINCSPVYSYLMRVALTARLEFFCQRTDWSEPEVERAHPRREDVDCVAKLSSGRRPACLRLTSPKPGKMALWNRAL